MTAAHQWSARISSEDTAWQPCSTTIHPPSRPGAASSSLPCSARSRSSTSSTRRSSTSRCPSIRHGLHFSVQDLQWVPSGYLLTYGGFMLLGGRLADLLGRRRVLVAGIVRHRGLVAGRRPRRQRRACSSARRLAQGLGAALTLPAALSILTTTFQDGQDRHQALGVWGGVGGLASAVGVFLGGVLTEGPGWRWVMLVNPVAVRTRPASAIFRLIAGDRRRAARADFDLLGAVLATGGMLLLVYGLVKAPDDGWGVDPHDRRARRRGRAARRLRRSTRRAAATRCCRCRSSGSAGWPPPTSPS